MLKFKEIELSDKPWIDELLKISDYRGCEYNFTNNFVWKDIFDVSVCRYKNYYICKSGDGFFFPAGEGNVDELLAQLQSYCDTAGIPFRFVSMDISAKDMLEKNYPGRFVFTERTDYFDYVYSSEALRTLSGKKLHSKRNYVNRFKTLNWSFEDITPDNIGECKKMSAQWCIINNCAESEAKTEELCAVGIGLEHFFELGLCGGILRVDGKIQAFSYGEQLSSDTFVTHVEKAFTDYDGAYPMINKLMAQRFCANFRYINREEDMGEENLRRAKRSYYPEFMVKKYSAVLNK